MELSLKIGVSGTRTEADGLVSSCSVITDPFKCKHCEQMLRLNLAVQILSVESVEQIEGEKTGSKLTKAQTDLLARWERWGLLAVWEEAIARTFPVGARPRPIPFLFKFLAKAQPVWPKREAVRAATGTDDARRVNCWEHAGITGMVINGYLRGFVSTRLLESSKVGFRLADVAGNPSARDIERRRYLERMASREDGWIKTRFGYVVGRGELFEEVRRHLYQRNSNVWPVEQPPKQRRA